MFLSFASEKGWMFWTWNQHADWNYNEYLIKLNVTMNVDNEWAYLLKNAFISSTCNRKTVNNIITDKENTTKRMF